MLDDPDLTEGIKEGELSVLIHIHGGKSFKFDGFKLAMGRSWHCGSFSIQRLDDMFFQVFFSTQETVDFALSNGLWNFDKNLVLVRLCIEGAIPSVHCVQTKLFWILLARLPRYCYTFKVGPKLKSMFYSVKIIHFQEDGALGTKFFLIQVRISLQKPLKRVIRVTTPDGTIYTGLLKYECLPTFCFICGTIGYRYRSCNTSMASTLSVKDLPFGPWLGAVDNVVSYQIFSLDVWMLVPGGLWIL